MSPEKLILMMAYAQLLHRCKVKNIVVFDIPVTELRMTP